MAFQPSRTSLQGDIVNGMKKNIGQIVAVLEEWAGKTGKPDFRKAEINSLCSLFDEHLATIAQSRRWSSHFVTLWQQFKTTWQDGDGSWTDAKKVARSLNDQFRDVEG
jgi:hypothetical protein